MLPEICLDVGDSKVKLVQLGLLVRQDVVHVGHVLGDISFSSQVVLGKYEQDLSGGLELTVRMEQTRIVSDQLCLLGDVQEVDEFQELLQCKLVQGVLTSVSVGVRD